MARSFLRSRTVKGTVMIGSLFVLCTAFVLTARSASAQSASGSISGNVVDASKQIVPGALVTLVDEQTRATRTTTSGDGGRFVFSAIQPGRYAVKVVLGEQGREIEPPGRIRLLPPQKGPRLRLIAPSASGAG